MRTINHPSAVKLLVGALLAVAASSANAQVYTDRTAFEAALSSSTTDTFEENGPGGNTSHGTTYSGSNFTITGTNLFTVDPAYDPYYDWNSGDVLDFETHPGTITVAPGVTALGFDFGNPSSFAGSGSVTINGVDYALIGQPNFIFWGIIDTTPLATISWNGGLGIMDNVTTGIGGAPNVPEPATWAMMLVGFGAIGYSMRRKQQSLAQLA